MSIFRRYAAYRATRREAQRRCALLVAMMAELNDMAADGLLAHRKADR